MSTCQPLTKVWKKVLKMKNKNLRNTVVVLWTRKKMFFVSAFYIPYSMVLFNSVKIQWQHISVGKRDLGTVSYVTVFQDMHWTF